MGRTINEHAVPGKFLAFVRLTRAKFLVGGLLGGALGTAVAAYENHVAALVAYAIAQFTITAAHLMTQYANDYYDRASDARTIRTPFSGGSGTLVDGSLAPIVALRAALVCMTASAAGIVALAFTGEALAAAIGCAIVVLAWVYSAPPLRLLARGLGELDTALVVAILVPFCTYAAQTQRVDARIVFTTLPGAAAMFAMMIAVQLPDFAADTQTGKRNLVVRYGTRNAAKFGALALSAIVALVIGARIAGAPDAYVASECFAVVPFALLAAGFRRLASRRALSQTLLAGLGVALFAIVSLLGIVGYVVPIGAKSRATSSLPKPATTLAPSEKIAAASSALRD